MDWGFAETGRGRDGRKIKLRIGLSRKEMLVVWTSMVAKGNRNKLKVERSISLDWPARLTSWNQDCRENINNLGYAHDTTLMAKLEKELQCLLMRVKEESEKANLKLNIHKTKIMASDPITSCQMDGEKWK